MKKVMILGSSSLQEPLIFEAIKKYYVVLVAPEINENLRKIVNAFYIEDVKNKEKILEYAKCEKIDGIITDQTDIAVRTVAYVSEKMKLPSITYEKGILFTDKSLMREKLKELNIKVLPYQEVDSLEKAVKFFTELNSPVIIKPLDSQGSRGVFKIDSKEDLLMKYNECSKYSRNGHILIEKFVTGKEFVVEGLVFDYKYTTLTIGDTYYFNIQNAFSANRRLFPSEEPLELLQRISAMNKKIIEGFGLKQGITHSEFIMDNDDIILIETAARGGGVYISSDVISITTGLNTEKFLLDICLGNLNTYPVIEKTNRACGYMAFYLPTGKVIQADGINKVKELKWVHHHQLDQINVGKIVHQSNDKTSRYAILVEGDNRKQLLERMSDIKNLLNIRIETDNGIATPIWN